MALYKIKLIKDINTDVLGDVPQYKIVLHNCDNSNNGKCINPWHLRLGSSKENTQDALRANTLRLLESNENNPMSKLTDLEVNEIKLLKGSGI